MVFEIINKISSILNDRLKVEFNLTKDIVKVQPIDGDAADGSVSISMVNIERDTSSGISFSRRNVLGGHTAKGNPSWDMNLYIIIAAVFPKKQYADSLKIITEVFKVLQENYLLTFNEQGLHYSIEPYNLSLQELSNIWSMSGGTYWPSVLCRIRTITIDSNTIIQIDANVEQMGIEL